MGKFASDAILRIELIQSHNNRLLDFGPRLNYPQICTAYTVPKFSAWENTTEEGFQVIVTRAPELPHTRLEGFLYSLTDGEMFTLDKKLGNEVECRRKSFPVFVPLLNSNGQMQITSAWIYVYRKDIWVDKIEYGRRVANPPTFKQRPPIPDPNPVLHNRYSFYGNQTSTHKVGEVSEQMNAYVRTRNSSEIERLKSASWKRKVYNFINDE